MSQINNINELYDLLVNYIKRKSTYLHLPKLQKELELNEEDSKYYYEAMKLIIPIGELRDSDIDLIPADKRQVWKDIKTIEEAKKIMSIPPDVVKDKDIKKTIKNIYHELYKNSTNTIDRIKEEMHRYHSEANIVGQLDEIKRISDNILSNQEIGFHEYSVIKMVLDEEHISGNLSEEQEYNINVILGKYMLADHGLFNELEIPSDELIIEDIEVNEEVLSENVLRGIFAKFNYNYDLISIEYKNKLQKLGKIDNIAGILSIISSNGILVYNDNINRLARITIYSKPLIVGDIINNIKADNKLEQDISKLFNIYLSEPRVFINGIQREVKNDKNKNFSESQNISESGYYNNYKSIRLFLKNHGINVNDVIIQCSSLFASSSRTVQDSFAKYRSYDIPEPTIFGKISCLKCKDVYEKLDGLIESGLEDYYKNYIARSSALTREVFVRIYLAKKLGIDPIKKIKDNTYLSGMVTSGVSGVLYRTYQKLMNTGSEPGEGIIINESNVEKYIGLTTYFDTPELQSIKSDYDDIVENAIYNKNSTIERNPYIQYLDENYIEDGIKYKIDNVIISRRKVLRLMDELLNTYNYKNNKELLMYVLTYKSLLNSEQLTSISRVVDDILKIGVELN